MHDGIHFVENALRMGTSGFKYFGFGHGAFFSIVLFIIYSFLYLIELLFGIISSKQDFLFQYVTNPGFLFLYARLAVIFFGMLALFLTYLIGRNLFNEAKIGLISCALVAFNFTSIQMSSIIKEDNLALFLLLLSFYSAIKIFLGKKNIKLWYVLSGFSLGLATATKYSFVGGLSFILTADWFLRRRSQEYQKRGIFYSIIHCFNVNIISSFLAMVIAFLGGNFFMLLDWSSFLKALSTHKAFYFRPQLLTNIGQILFFYRHSLGGPLFIMIVISIFFLIWKDIKKTVLLLIFPILLLAIFSLNKIPSYFILPTIPFFAISLSYLLLHIFKAIKIRQLFFRICLICLCIVILWPSFLNAMRFKKVMASPDTRMLAKEWIEENIQGYSSILEEGAVASLLIFAPQLNPDRITLEEEKRIVVSQKGLGRLVDMRLAWLEKNPQAKSFRIHRAKIINQDLIKEFKPEFIILSGVFDLETNNPRITPMDIEGRGKAKRIIDEDYILIKEIEAYPKFSDSFPFLSEDDYQQLEKIKLLTNLEQLSAGYDIYIFKRKGSLNNKHS